MGAGGGFHTSLQLLTELQRLKVASPFSTRALQPLTGLICLESF